jgi:hypothetical protein
MTLTKSGLLGLCAMVIGILSISVNATQASTLSWLILPSGGGAATELKAELLGERDDGDLTLLGEIGGFEITITCPTFELKGLDLEVGGKLTSGGKITFRSCDLYDKGTLEEPDEDCAVKSPGAVAGLIETKELKGELVLVGGALLAKVEPKTGSTGTFATIRIEGPECGYIEVNQVHGVFYAKDCGGFATTHKVKHLIESAAASTALYIGGHSAGQLANTKIDGSAWVKLGDVHDGLEWSGMDV